jgi:hypothetical protein
LGEASYVHGIEVKAYNEVGNPDGKRQVRESGKIILNCVSKK